MSFREMVAADNLKVFCNTDEFADLHTITYDGQAYEGVPCTITRLEAKDRVIPAKDHAKGIYLVTAICQFPREKLGGKVPEKGSKIGITDETDFLRHYYVAQSGCALGMVRLELEAYDE